MEIEDSNIRADKPHASTADDDFLARERAALGDDAAQFASENDHNAAPLQDDEDLLGGGDNRHTNNDQFADFESSFPTVDTHNEVSLHRS